MIGLQGITQVYFLVALHYHKMLSFVSVLWTVDDKSTNCFPSKCLIDGVCSVPQTCHLNSTDPV